MPKTAARFSAPALLVALALPLAGCETTGDPVARVVTAPGQYDLYDCPAIKVAAAGVIAQQKQLEGLMVRADRGPAGGLINATTYQPEYITLRGRMDQLRHAAAVNNCGFDPATVQASTVPVQPLMRTQSSTWPERR